MNKTTAIDMIILTILPLITMIACHNVDNFDYEFGILMSASIVFITTCVHLIEHVVPK
jgi:hypothetical protein